MDIKSRLIAEKIIQEAISPGRERIVSAVINSITTKKPSRIAVRNYLKNIEKTDKAWIQAMRRKMEEIGEPGGRAYFFSALRSRIKHHFERG
jgi:hypothetical protein